MKRNSPPGSGESLAHRAAYVRVEAAWKRTERLAVLRATMRAQAQSETRERFRFFPLRAAAVLLIAGMLGAGAAAWLWSESKTQTYATAVGGRETLALADGSKIELNTDTQLRTQITASERKIWLDKGEAYFEVKHDAVHPFVVIVGNHRVTDMGTKFFIRRDAARVEVALVEGHAQLDALNSPTRAPSIQMVPGDVVVASADRVETAKKPVATLSSDLSWRRGLLVFKHTTLGEAATEFNRYNREKLVIADTVTAQLQIGGTFQSDSIADFAEVAKEVLGVRIEHQSNKTVISR